MKEESNKAKQERKDRYISYVLSKNHGGANRNKLILEASAKFEKANK